LEEGGYDNGGIMPEVDSAEIQATVDLAAVMHQYDYAQNNVISIVLDTETLPLSPRAINTKSQLAYWVSGFPARPLESIYQVLLEENAMLRSECDRMAGLLDNITQRLSLVENTISKEDIIVLREISREDAKAEIASLFSQGKVMYYSDVARELKLDLELVVDLCNELMDEGKIEVAESNP
jgi:hypothetical protein